MSVRMQETAPKRGSLMPYLAIGTMALVGGLAANSINNHSSSEARADSSFEQPNSSYAARAHLGSIAVTYQRQVVHKKTNPWKYSFSKPSHGPLRPKLQAELNSITPTMYRKMMRIGDDCEGRKGEWEEDNGHYGGGLNIEDKTWPAFGGTEFAPVAQDATPAEQMDILMRDEADNHWGVPSTCPLAHSGPWSKQDVIFLNWKRH